MSQHEAMPMQVIAVFRGHALCEAQGVRHDVSLFLLGHEPVEPGDWLSVDREFALHVLARPRGRMTAAA